jgi:elongation factor 1-gamma
MSVPACVNTLQTQEEPEINYDDVPQNDPFKYLPKSPMNLAQCKNDYFLSREKKENYFTEKFWQTYDKEGYSIHRGSYKYNDEFSPLAFIRRNVVTGIIQSMDSTIAHKNLFGVFKLYSNKKLECVFITRGDFILQECVGDMIESFEFVKLDTSDENERNFIADFFGKEEDDSIEFYVRFV